MSMILMAMMASAQVMPWLDRASLDKHANIESLSRAPVRTRLVRVAVPAKTLLASDVHAITTVCKTASHRAQPGLFLESVGRAYAMSTNEVVQLKQSCAIFIAGSLGQR